MGYKVMTHAPLHALHSSLNLHAGCASACAWCSAHPLAIPSDSNWAHANDLLWCFVNHITLFVLPSPRLCGLCPYVHACGLPCVPCVPCVPCIFVFLWKKCFGGSRYVCHAVVPSGVFVSFVFGCAYLPHIIKFPCHFFCIGPINECIFDV